MGQISPWGRTHSPTEVADAEYLSNPDSEDVHLRDYWKLLVKRRRLIILVFLIVVGLGAYKTVSETPLYTATATLQIEPQTAVIQIGEILAPAEDDAGGPYDYYQTQF